MGHDETSHPDEEFTREDLVPRIEDALERSDADDCQTLAAELLNVVSAIRLLTTKWDPTDEEESLVKRAVWNLYGSFVENGCMEEDELLTMEKDIEELLKSMELHIDSRIDRDIEDDLSEWLLEVMDEDYEPPGPQGEVNVMCTRHPDEDTMAEEMESLIDDFGHPFQTVVSQGVEDGLISCMVFKQHRKRE